MYIRVHACTYVHVLCTYVCAYVSMCVCICTLMRVRARARVCVCVCVCVWDRVYVCMYACMRAYVRCVCEVCGVMYLCIVCLRSV